GVRLLPGIVCMDAVRRDDAPGLTSRCNFRRMYVASGTLENEGLGNLGDNAADERAAGGTQAVPENDNGPPPERVKRPCRSRRWGTKEIQAQMPDYYHAPALVLSALLLPAFGYLYLRFRD